MKLRRDLGTARGIHLHLFFSLGNSCLSGVRGSLSQESRKKWSCVKDFLLKIKENEKCKETKPIHDELWWLRNLSAAEVYLGQWLRREGFSVGRAEAEEDVFK